MNEVHNDLNNIVNNYSKTHKHKLKPIRCNKLYYKSANGAGYARNIIQKQLYKNEDYFIQIDSHSRFSNKWDILAIEQFKLAIKYRFGAKV